jgi:hypothetical protein
MFERLARGPKSPEKVVILPSREVDIDSHRLLQVREQRNEASNDFDRASNRWNQ